MYNQQEASSLRHKFWISFGRYIAPVPSSTGERINWLNYRTGIKFINFRMDCINRSAYVSIEISGKDVAERALYFNHFNTFRKALEEILGEKWNWEPTARTEHNNLIARIYMALDNVDVYNENEWPRIISFLKQRIIALDKFWNEYKDIFDMLA